MTAVAVPAPARRRFGALRDIGIGIVAVGTKELRGRMRGRRAFIFLTFYLVVLAGFAWMMELIQEQRVNVGFGNGSFFAAAQIGREVFIGLLMFQTLLVVFLAPAFTAGAISLEREKQTLDLLATTPICSLAIVLGKLASALTYVFLLILASIPLTALVFVVRRGLAGRPDPGLRRPVRHGLRARHGRPVRVIARPSAPRARRC